MAHQLDHGRAWHSATVLPDGTVLIAGGLGVDGRVVDLAERFHPDAQTFEPLLVSGVITRAGHTATLLTDGRVLFAGGVSQNGNLVAEIELWDPATQDVEVLSA